MAIKVRKYATMKCAKMKKTQLTTNKEKIKIEELLSISKLSKYH
jgi:hypothetical protein